MLLLGSSEAIRVIRYGDGKPAVACRERVTEEVFRINVTPSGKLAVTAHADGTLRWYAIVPEGSGCRLSLLVSVHVVRTARGEWIWAAWTPAGRHAQHPSLAARLEWQFEQDGRIRRTPVQSLQRWYDPRAVWNALDAATGGAMPAGAGSPDVGTLARLAPPERRISLQGDLGTIEEPLLPVTLAVAEAGGWPKPLSVRINNTPASFEHEGRRFAPGESLHVEPSMLGSGVIDLMIDVPPTARLRQGPGRLCFHVGEAADGCWNFVWAGRTEKPRRRLWAVVAGIGRYPDPRMTLRYAANDAIDLVRLFLRDYDERVRLKQSPAPADYEEVHLNLVVSGMPESEEEARLLAERPEVRLFPAGKAGLLAAVEDILARRQTHPRGSDEGDDLFLFYYSGHGLLDPAERDSGRTVLASADLRRSPDAAELARHGVSSSELLRLLDRMPGNQLIVFDACRSESPEGGVIPFDPGAIGLEARNYPLRADIFYSSSVLEPSREANELAFDGTRQPEARRGNSLFAYGLLLALTRLPRDHALPGAPLRVSVDRIREYLRDEFFNPDNGESRAVQLMKAKNWPFLQRPTHVAQRIEQRDPRIVRTLVRP
jgi:hypothetical protein